MKKILSMITAAAVLAATLTGCAAKTLSEDEYKEQVTELFCDYYSEFHDAVETFKSSYDSLIVKDLDEFFDGIKETMKDVEKDLDETDEYLEKIQKLSPPAEMQDFHEDLLSALEKQEDEAEKLVAIGDAKDVDEFNDALNKFSSSLEKAGKAFDKIADDDDNEWFVEAMDDEFGEGFFG